MATVQDILNILQDIAADDLAEAWDNIGLLIGNPDNRVSSILVGLDPTVDLLSQATDCNAQLIITHHPAIFHPLKALRTDQPTGSFISRTLRHNINVVGCHTNLDATAGGVSDVLARTLGLIETAPLVPANISAPGCGLGRIGSLQTPTDAGTFITLLQNALTPPWLLEAGPRPERVSRVAVCGGSCSDFADTALAAGADVFITAEVKHAAARWAEEAGLWLIDAGHFATEHPAIRALQTMLAGRLKEINMEVQVCTARQDPPLKLITD